MEKSYTSIWLLSKDDETQRFIKVIRFIFIFGFPLTISFGLLTDAFYFLSICYLISLYFIVILFEYLFAFRIYVKIIIPIINSKRLMQLMQSLWEQYNVLNLADDNIERVCERTIKYSGKKKFNRTFHFNKITCNEEWIAV